MIYSTVQLLTRCSGSAQAWLFEFLTAAEVDSEAESQCAIA